MGTPSAGYWKTLPGRDRWLLAVAAVLTVIMLPGLARLETDNSPEIFFLEQSADYSHYQDLVAHFGHDQTLRLVFSGEALWSKEGLLALGALEERVAALPGVVRASGLYEHHGRFGWPPKDIEAFQKNSLLNNLDRNIGWISQDGALATCLIQLEKLRPDARNALLESLRRALADLPPGLDAQMVGLGVLNAELDESSREIEQRFFPLLVVLTILLLAVVVRNFSQLLAPLLFVLFCQALTLGLMGYQGVALNMVLAVLPPIIFVISLATAVHLTLRVRHVAGSPPSADDQDRTETTTPDEIWRESVIQVFAEKGWAIFWTGITTTVGFASLMASDVAPVRSLGAWAALGLFLTTVAAFTVLPALILQLSGGGLIPGPRAATFEHLISAWGAAWARFAVRNRFAVLVGLLALAGVAALGLPRLSVESNALRYLAPDHPLRLGIESAEARGIGVAALELLITVPTSGGGAPAPFVSSLEVDGLADLATDLAKLDEIYGVFNAGVVLRDALLHVPQTPGNAHLRSQMALDGLGQDAQGREVLDSLLTEDRQTARSTVFVATAGVDELQALETKLIEAVKVRFPTAQAIVSGEYRLLLMAQKSLISTLVISLALTFVAIAFVLRFLLPSSRLSALSLIPNLWPVLGGLGLMGWTGMPLDIATVMMASVVLGLAVDDTIHTLGHFRRWAPEVGASEAVERTLYATAPAYLLTGIILMAGFGVCGLSDFAPIARFGLLSAFSIGLAVLGDLLVLPALLSLTPEKVCQRLKKPSSAQAG